MNYERPNEWVNYGDVNPQKHGGIFVKWTNGHWHIIETRGSYMNHHYIDPNDVWVEGEPLNGFTDWAADQLESYSNGPFHLNDVNNPDLPDDVTFAEHMRWIVDNHTEWIVGSLAIAYVGYYGPHKSEKAEDYWAYLENYGIEEQNF